jgi:hypothetical protein
MNNRLKKKLKELAELEREHKVTGVSFAIKKGYTVTTEESVDHAIDIIKKGSELIENKSKYKVVKD